MTPLTEKHMRAFLKKKAIRMAADEEIAVSEAELHTLRPMREYLPDSVWAQAINRSKLAFAMQDVLWREERAAFNAYQEHLRSEG